MIEGFWIVQFEGVQGGGAGVAVLVNGKIFGGETGFTYLGSYTYNRPSLKARVRVQRFLSNIDSFFGMDDYELEVEGTLEGGVITASASLIPPVATGLALKLTRKASLS